jgi:KDO2-lipid IV(A) lauroyltransferase
MKLRNLFLNMIFWVIALLPFTLLYLLSDVLAFTIHYVFGYRRGVVHDNLRRSFPEKTQNEILKIANKFYRNLTDLMVEVIKSNKMTREQVEQRIKFVNQEVLEDDLYDARKNVFALLGHCGNWEWVGNKIATFLKHDGGAIYKPVQDKFFDDYLVKQRQKYKGTLMIDYKKVFRTLVTLKDKLITVFVLADQSPARTEMDYFVNFLGQKTAFYDGMDKVARALNYAVIYLDVQRIKRGYYEVEIKTIAENAKETPEDFITKSYVRLLEETIRKSPDNWLWSHKRWKVKEGKSN